MRTIFLFFLCLTTGSVWADVEPNNDIASATPLVPATEVSGTLNTGGADADDYYEVVLPENGFVQASVTYEDGLTGFVYFYRSNGVQITNTFVSGAATLSADCIGSGAVYVRVNSSGTGDYSLAVNFTPSGQPADAEPNGTLNLANEVFNTNTEFTGQLGYSGTNSSNVTDTDDWFYVVLDDDGLVTLDVTIEGSLTGFMYLYNKNGVQITNVNTDDGINTLSADCIEQDTIAVRISRSGGCGSYTASVSVTPPAFADDDEPNNTQGSALEIVDADESFTGRIGYADADTGIDTDDWYDVILDDDGLVTLNVEYTGSLTGFIYLYNKNGVLVSSTSAVVGNNSLQTDCFAQDTIQVRLSRSGGCGSYTASVSVTPPTYQGDIEPNGNLASVQEIFNSDEVFTGRLGNADADTGVDTDDWYEVVLDDDGLASLTINPAGSLNGFIYFYTKSGVLLSSSFYAAETETTLFNNCLAQDTVVVRVFRSGGCGSYSASVSVQPSALPGDAEPNNTLLLAQELFQTDESFTGRLGYLDSDSGTDTDDWYQVVLSNDGTANVNILSNGTLNGFVYLYSKAGVLYSSVFYQDSIPNTLSVSCIAQDTAYVRVLRSGGCGSYSVSVNVSPDIYANDAEPNNSIATAIPTNGGVINEGHLGYFDVDSGTDVDDYYTFQVASVPFELEAELQVVGSLSGFFYIYTGSGVQLINTSYSEGQTVLPYVINTPGTYAVRLTRSGGCGQYQLNPLCGSTPEVSIVEGDQSICPGEGPVTFTATAGLAEYEWVFDAGIVGSESTLTANEPGEYFVRGIDANGCIGVSEVVTLHFFDLPSLSITPSEMVELCAGETQTLTASGGFASYEWSNGATGQAIEVSQSGVFSVEGTTADGCTATSTEVDVTVFAVPDLTITADGDIELCLGSSVTLSANDAFESYVWSNGETGSSIEVDESGIYFVTGTTIDGCDAVSNSLEVIVYDDEGPCVLDCAGVPGGSSILDECGVCDDNPSNDNETCTDCAGVINGNAFLDNCGECVGGTTGEEPCAEDCFGVPGGNGVVDDCGVCREANDPDFNSTCLDCAGVPNGESILDDCGICRLPEDPDFNSTCLDCAGVPNGNSTEDECGVCDAIAGNDNETCADCEGVPNGPAQPGTSCDADGQPGTYNENCACVPDVVSCDYIYFLASANDFGGSDIYSFTADNDADEADLSLIASLEAEVSLAYDEMSGILYMLHRDQSAFQTLDLNATEVTPSEVVTTPYSISGFSGASFHDGELYASSELTNRIYKYDPVSGIGMNFAAAIIEDGDIAFGDDGELYVASSGPQRLFQVMEGTQGSVIGFVPAGSSGLALRSDGNLLLSVDGRNRLIVGDTDANDLLERVYLFADGVPFFVSNGDLASGCVPANPLGIWTGLTTERETDLSLDITPNPTEGTSYAVFSSSTESNATLEVFDMSGRRVTLLFNGMMDADTEYRTEFDGSGLPNGIYLYRYTSGSKVESRKLIIAR